MREAHRKLLLPSFLLFSFFFFFIFRLANLAFQISGNRIQQCDHLLYMQVEAGLGLHTVVPVIIVRTYRTAYQLEESTSSELYFARYDKLI